MQELTVSWLNHSPPITWIFHPNQPTKTLGKFRIGREPQICDLVLPSATTADCLVSRVHAEIYFDDESHYFYLHNLKAEKPLLILEGRPVPSEPVPFLKPSLLQLAHHHFQITVQAESTSQTVASSAPPLKPLICPHCNTGYTYAESTQMNGRCHKDGFLLYGHSICIVSDR